VTLDRSVVALLVVLLFATACDNSAAPVLPVGQGSPPASAGPSVAPPPASGSPPQPGTLPNAGLTPGEVFAGVTAAQVCVSGYAGRARNVLLDQYRQVYAAYGIPYPEPAGTYELDHLVPLELGGDNANRNLWPEPAAPVPGFHQKDELENYLHDAVCAGRMQLSDAQAGIAANWLLLYHRYLQP
jgi:hypothetical protein